MPISIRGLFIFILAFTLTSCATLDPDYEEPTVTLSSFNALPSEGMIPAFEIGLRIINPNTQPLNLVGIVYTDLKPSWTWADSIPRYGSNKKGR